MLQGRVAPPPSPAVDGSQLVSGPPPRAPPLPLSRRNSFSRDSAAAIAQTRAPPPVSTASDIQLHVGETLRPLSPRKSASFSLPRSPRPDDVLRAPEPTRTLRPTLSDPQLRRLLDGDPAAPLPVRTPLDSAAAAVADSPSKSAASEDEEGDDHDGDASSAASSSYSRASPANEDGVRDDDDTEEEDQDHNDDDDDDSDASAVVDDPDAFDAWLQDARVLESPVPVRTREPAQASTSAADLSAPLLRLKNAAAAAAASSSLALSKSVQQIEHEIRVALDSAAARVTASTERSDLLARELRDIRGGPDAMHSPHAASVPLVIPASEIETERELLLLMDVLIGDGRSATIEVRAGDRPEQLAAAFAAAHGLVADAVPRLTQHIQDQLAALDDEEEDGEEDSTHDRQPMAQDTAQSGYPGQFHPHSDDPDDLFAYAGGCGGDDVDFADDLSAFDDSEAHDDHDDPYARHQPPSRPESAPRAPREYEREHSYNHLMEKYGHYTSHSNKVNPTAKKATLAPQRRQERPADDPLTMRNVELSEHARIMFTPRPAATFATTKLGGGKDKSETVYSRLYALAEAREKWIRRQQKAKAADEVRERQALSNLEISAKSRDMVAGRGSGGYAHIGERLYNEALSDMAKKQREREKRERERAEQLDWTCPKCAFVNQHGDAVCKNVVAAVALPPPAPISTSRRETAPLSQAALLDAHPEVVCGHARPQELFRPTLLGAPASVARAVQHNKTRATAASASSQRQRTQQQMEDEFRQTCPFKPKLNEVSEEIMRDKLEQEVKAAGGGERRRDPHQALYEDAFHARAAREAREEAHLRQFPFKPNIGVNALWSKRADESEDVVERLAVTKYQELERKRTSLHAKYAPDRDPVTGREYFKPETGRAPIFTRNERGLPIGDFLYEAHREQEEYKRRLQQQEDEQRRQRREQHFVSGTSRRALEARKKKTVARLFAWLVTLARDPDAEADAEPRVVPSAVDVSAMSQEMARILSIVFEFANHEPFAFAAFERFMDKLMADVPGLTLTQVLFLADHLDDGKSARRAFAAATDAADDDPELTFRPAIDKNSDALAKKHGRGDRPSVFEALNQYYDHYKDRQEQAKKQRERDFTRAHPFQPTFYTKDRKAKAAKFYDRLHHQEMTTTIATGGTVAKDAAMSAAPLLRTAVPNARPFVRPLGRTPSDQTLRSRSSSVAGDDDDAALTSHVLAALGDGAAGKAATAAPTAAATPSAHHSALSALFSGAPSAATAPVGPRSLADLAH